MACLRMPSVRLTAAIERALPYSLLKSSMVSVRSNAPTGRTKRLLQRGKATSNRGDAAQRLGDDVALVVLVEECCDRHPLGGRRRGRLAWVPARDDLADELRLPDLFGFLFRRNRLRRAADQSKCVNRHAISLAVMHDVEPRHAFDVRALRVRREIPPLHALEHPLPKGGHTPSSAAPPGPFQAWAAERIEARRSPRRGLHMCGRGEGANYQLPRSGLVQCFLSSP